jgi:hypothetical protein
MTGQKTVNAFFIAGMMIIFILAALPFGAFAQDENEQDESLLETMSPSRWVFLAFIGGGQTGVKGQLQYDQVPEDYEDETSFSSSTGDALARGIEAWWFPTSGRSFLLTGSLLYQTGFNTIKVKDEEDYGARNLDKKSLRYSMNNILLGLGYRFLYGEKEDYGTNVYAKFGGGGADIVIEDLMNGSGGNASLEIGANFYHRFDNDLLIGVQWDLRGWGMWATGMEMKYLNTDADFGGGGGGSFLSVIGGWELI